MKCGVFPKIRFLEVGGLPLRGCVLTFFLVFQVVWSFVCGGRLSCFLLPSLHPSSLWLPGWSFLDGEVCVCGVPRCRARPSSPPALGRPGARPRVLLSSLFCGVPVGSALLSWIPHRVPVPPRASFSSGADVRRGCGSFLLVRLLGPGSSAAVSRDSSFGLCPFSLVFSSALLFLSRVCLDSPSRVATLPVFTDEGALSSGLSFPLHSLWVEKMVRTSLEFLVQSSSLHGFF